MENEKKKSSVGSAIGVVVLVAASVTGGWVACDLWPKKAAPKMQIPQMAASVAVRPVEERLYNLPERFVAHAEPVQEVELLPQVDGYVKEIRFKEGDIVEAGDTLYVLDGEGEFVCECGHQTVKKAEQYFVPADTKKLTIKNTSDKPMTILISNGPKI